MADVTSEVSAGSPSDTRDRILEVAGALFADHGFRSVSLRRITQEAGVNVASVNYHFGSKEALILEVLSRIVGPINAQRIAMLDAAEDEYGDGAVPVERILEALFAPLLEVIGTAVDGGTALDTSAGNQSSADIYLKLVGRCMSERQELMPETMMKLFQKTIDRFCKATIKALPSVDSTDVFWRLHFTAGALLYTLSQPERLAAFSRGKVDPSDGDEMLRQLIAYTAAGMKAEAASDWRKGDGFSSKMARRRSGVSGGLRHRLFSG